ncbi:LppU/SCO3897 family protein [Saccharothrix xinjiangensis]|uniref:Uncharacterized protein n=1 Tax=Saccharothrix xinjiangensis TaxID=204798 RepID=A0ABV9XX35_9PSEU
MTTPPNQPPYGEPQGFPPPQQPAWGQPSPQGFPGHHPQQPGQPGHPQPDQAYPQPGHPPAGQAQAYPQPGHPQGFPPPAYPPPGQTGYAAPAQPGHPQPGHPQGYPQPYAQPAHPPYPAGGQHFPPPKRGLSQGVKALVGVVVLGVAGLTVVGMIGNAGGPGGAVEGDCLKIDSVSVTESEAEQVDCGAPEAAFKVATRLGSGADACPEGDYTEFYSTGGRRSDGYKLCLVLNAAEGDCFKQEGTIVAAKTTKVTCGTPNAFKVERVIGGSDENACASGDTVVVYSLPATTICLTRA